MTDLGSRPAPRELLARIEELTKERDHWEREWGLVNENLTAVQARCTALLLELRDFRIEHARTLASGRSSGLSRVLCSIREEVYRARQKHPRVVFPALVEEVGEVAKALLDKEPLTRLHEELTQVAAVAVRLLTEDDWR